MNLYLAMVVMLIAGALNTLLMKFQVRQLTPESPGAAPTVFDHPYLQTLMMMTGELMCLVVFVSFFQHLQPTKIPNTQKALFSIPVFCDMTATTLVNYAFLMIPASVVQMTRGSIVLFTCILSVAFLGRRLETFHYVGVALVSGGISLVSLTAVLYPNGGQVESFGSPLIGITLCLLAQTFQASQLVIEEKFILSMRMDPLLAIGLEGLFGCVVMSCVLPVVAAVGSENVTGAFYQMGQNAFLTVAVVLSICSIAFFNWSGITVTKNASAVARSTIDCSRTIIVWVVELALAWNRFHLMQLVGFLMLAFGTMLYNELLPMPLILRDATLEESKPLIKRQLREEIEKMYHEHDATNRLKPQSA
eukprot:GEMP01023234.1.p1 GENE.GEMP01023234.1~~GEMP01023234.1.p1  ORF type:complete len:362 (+),score=53.05 GEMP01023234.1:146-1231(+)